MTLSNEEKIKILTDALKQYASLINWSRCKHDDSYLNRWYLERDGFEIARNALDFIKKHEIISDSDK